MTRMVFFAAAVAAAPCFLVSCQGQFVHAPQTPAELRQHIDSKNQELTFRSIALHNLTRVMDKNLPANQRLDSLHVLEQIDASNVEIYPSLAVVLGDADAPINLRREILSYLIQTNYPGLGEQIAAALPTVNDQSLRVAIIEWLIQNPKNASFPQVVKLWAMEKKPAAEVESHYRQLVEQLSGVAWDQALLGALNADDFTARGSALEVLQGRMSTDQLRGRIAAIAPRSETMKAMRYFSEHFGYMPRTGRELLSEVVACQNGPDRLYPATVLAFGWQRQYGYRFNPRDIHLLSRLANDPARKESTRQKLTQSLLASVRGRRLVRPAGAAYATPGKVAPLESQVDALSMSDLWTLYLSDRQLSLPAFRTTLQARAEKENASRQPVQLGGLVVYEQGHAKASLYPPGEQRADFAYTASPQMQQDAADCLCFFIVHFGPERQQTVLGPSEREVNFGRDFNLDGLVLTGLGQAAIAGTFFTPGGAIIDLGDYPQTGQ